MPTSPSTAALAFTKEASPEADQLVSSSVLFKWPVVGWCVGKITRRNTDARFSTRLEDGTSPKKNFFIYYEMDDEEVNTYLCANWYGGDDDGSWVLLEPVEGAGTASGCSEDADV